MIWVLIFIIQRTFFAHSIVKINWNTLLILWSSWRFYFWASLIACTLIFYFWLRPVSIRRKFWILFSILTILCFNDSLSYSIFNFQSVQHVRWWALIHNHLNCWWFPLSIFTECILIFQINSLGLFWLIITTHLLLV